MPPEVPVPVDSIRQLRLSGLLHRALRTRDDSRASAFATDYRTTTVRNLLLLERAAAARDLLASEGVPCVPIKGAAFLIRFSSDDLGVRPLADVDTLVPDDAFERALTLLAGHGWLPIENRKVRSGPTAPAVTLAAETKAGWTQVDLHRQLAQWPLLPWLPREVLARAEACHGWLVPTVSDTVLVAALHRARHGFLLDARDLVDVQRAVEGLDEDEWRRLCREAARHGLTGAVYATMRQATWWFGAAGELERPSAPVSELRGTIGPLRRTLLERMARVAGPYASAPVWQRPVVRNFTVNLAAFHAPARVLVSAATFLPRRAWEEWERATHEGASATQRMARMAHLLLRGARPGR